MNRLGTLAVWMAGALALACGSDPAKYLVALNQSALASLPGSCYPGGTPPIQAPQIVELVSHEFTVWDGAKGKHFLEIDRVAVSFPSSANLGFMGLIEGGPRTWTFSATADRGNSVVEARQMQFNFNDLSDTLEGTAAVTSTFTCPAPPCGFQDCSVSLGLNGRKIQASGLY